MPPAAATSQNVLNRSSDDPARILLDVSESDIPADASVDEAWEQEIARRMARVEDGTAKYRSSADVFAELDRRFPG